MVTHTQIPRGLDTDPDSIQSPVLRLDSILPKFTIQPLGCQYVQILYKKDHNLQCTHTFIQVIPLKTTIPTGKGNNSHSFT